MDPVSPDLKYFATMVLQGVDKIEAHRIAYPRMLEDRRVPHIRRVQKTTEYLDLVKGIQESINQAKILSLQEKRERLKEIIDFNIMALTQREITDAEGRIIESVKKTYNKDGDLISITYRMPSRLAALKLDNEMAGHLAALGANKDPEESGVMVVGEEGSLEEWEDAAIRQQEELRGE